MNPNNPTPSFELPPPVPQEGLPARGESRPAIPEQYTQPQQPAPVQPIPVQQPVMPVGQRSASSATSATPGARQTASPMTADDTDLIEKEWIVKAKQIIAATKDDPHVQNKELSKFKADYLKKRYNKDVKVDE